MTASVLSVAGGGPTLPKRVLITGATGNLGSKAAAALRALDDVEVIGIADRPANADLGITVVIADLAIPDGEWSRCFEGVDVVLHLAADPRPVASWESVVANNIDLSLNVLDAAERHAVGRVVFASSNWVLGGYRFRRKRSRPPTPAAAGQRLRHVEARDRTRRRRARPARHRLPRAANRVVPTRRERAGLAHGVRPLGPAAVVEQRRLATGRAARVHRALRRFRGRQCDVRQRRQSLGSH